MDESEHKRTSRQYGRSRLSRHEQKRRKRSRSLLTKNAEQQQQLSTIVPNSTAPVMRYDDDDDDSDNGIDDTQDYSLQSTITTRRTTSSTHIKDDTTRDKDGNDTILIYQHEFNKYRTTDLSIAFFELANASKVCYEISTNIIGHNNNNDDRTDMTKHNYNTENRTKRQMLIFQQDLATRGLHTGGIIWETSYLLLEYLLLEYYHDDDDDDDNKFNKKSLGRVLEVGAGCGLLGQCLAATAAIKNQQQQQQKNQQQNTMSSSFKAVVMTDVEPVLNNLRQNVQSNLPILKQQTSNCTGPSHVLDSKQTAVIGHDKLDSIQVCELDWTDIDRCVQSSNGLLQQHTYDVVVGTDILFAPHLAIPLLRTIQWATHKGSVVYICVHQRCSKTHEIFQSQSNKYDLIVEDISDEVYSKYPSIQWGKQLECILFRIKKTM